MTTLSPATPLDISRFQPQPSAPRELTQPRERVKDQDATAGQSEKTSEAREVFEKFVGTTVFSQLLASMRKTVDKPAYFHGGRAEEVFQGQLDQILAEKMSEASADQLAGPMYELWQLNRS